MKVLTVVGARPQFVKAAMVSHAILESGRISEKIVHTGQHYDADMSGTFFSELHIPEPEYNLNIGGLSHGVMTGRMLEGLEPIIQQEAPDLVLVYGDTNSTLAGALAASKLNVPVAHVEAGLRSFNRAMPEEINRVVTDHLSSLLFCPTQGAVDQLANEGIRDNVHRVGDVMYDAALVTSRIAGERSTVLADLALEPGSYQVATLHRAENTDTREALLRAVDWLEDEATRDKMILPQHPRTASKMEQFGLGWKKVRAVPPLGYLDMTALLANCGRVLTDSGGLQKEAYFHRKPCVTLRDETEWVETIECGWNRLWTVADYAERRPIDSYGDGTAAQQIVQRLLAFPSGPT